MTNLEALKGMVNNATLAENSYKLALVNHSLNDTDTYVVANKQSLELAAVDCIKTIVTTGNVSEGGFSVSQSDKQELIKLAASICRRYGYANPFASSAEFKQPW